MKVKFELMIKLLEDLIGVVKSIAEVLPDEHETVTKEIVESETKRLSAQAEKDNEEIQKNVEEKKAAMAASQEEEKKKEEARKAAEEEEKKKAEEERQQKIKEASEALQEATVQLNSLKEKEGKEDDQDIKDILAVKIKKAEAALDEARKSLEEIVNGKTEEQAPEIPVQTVEVSENKSEVEDDLHQEIDALYRKRMSLNSIVKEIVKKRGQESVVFVIDDPIMKPLRNALKKVANPERLAMSTLGLSQENAKDLADYVKRSK